MRWGWKTGWGWGAGWMTHDAKCEMGALVRAISRKMNATAYEISLVKQFNLCFCASREELGREFLIPRSVWVDRMGIGVELILNHRTSNTRPERTSTVSSGEIGGEEMGWDRKEGKEGNVIWVDFRARRKVIHE